jgi:hypothetical protein
MDTYELGTLIRFMKISTPDEFIYALRQSGKMDQILTQLRNEITEEKDNDDISSKVKNLEDRIKVLEVESVLHRNFNL